MHDTTPSLRDLWARAVEPVAAVTHAAEREQARLLASMLLVLLVLGALSCVVQLALVDGFFPTFRFIAGALLGVAGAYALSRTPRFRIAVWLAALFVIAACTATGLRDPNDHVWYAFALIAVLLGSTFLELRAAMALWLATLAAVAFTLAHTSTSQSAAALVAPVMIHLVVSPLVLVLSRHRAKVEALRSELLRRREQQLFETRHLAALGRLASQTAHDFNNVLTVVLGNSAAMISSRSFEAAPLEEIQLAGQQAARLSRQLVAFASDQPPALQPLNLRNVVRDLKPVLQRLVGEKVRIELHEAAELPLVQASVVHLEQLLLNLVINARDAMAEGGVLTITTGLQRAATALGDDGAQRVVLQVRDTGLGMDEATQAAIFDAFFTTKASQGGAGLGLSIVRDVVDRHGGTIRVESALGQGSTFEVTFPSVRTSAEDDARAASFAAQPAD